MKVEIKDTCYGDGSMKDVIFDDAYAAGRVPAELAESIKARCEFRHGIKCDGKLVAVFRDEFNRDLCRFRLDEIRPEGPWENVTCG